MTDPVDWWAIQLGWCMPSDHCRTIEEWAFSRVLMAVQAELSTACSQDESSKSVCSHPASSCGELSVNSILRVESNCPPEIEWANPMLFQFPSIIRQNNFPSISASNKNHLPVSQCAKPFLPNARPIQQLCFPF